MVLPLQLSDLLQALTAPIRDVLVRFVPEQWMGSLPALTLVLFAVLALLVGRHVNPLPVSLLGVVLSAVTVVTLDASTYGSSFGGLFVRDAFSDFFIYIILIVAVLVLVSSTLYGGDKGPYDFLLLTSMAGAIWVVMATDLVGLFLAWELMSTPTYVLTALGPHRGAVDGAVKYFVMGMMASALMLFGIALVYGVTGSTELATVAQTLNTMSADPTVAPTMSPTVLLAVVLFILSFGFKTGIFPGWMWVPDTYSTADGSVTAYLAGATKKTGVSALVRILMVGLLVSQLEWTLLLVVVSIMTMVIGNVLALAQKNIMRMLAYSSIAMMGYLFIGLAAGTEFGLAAAIFHAFIHALLKTTAFILVWAMAVRLRKVITYDDLVGLSERSPLAAALLCLAVLGLLGVPVTGGFWSKLFLFQSAVEADMWWLALIGALNTVFSLGYYLRVVRSCYMAAPTRDDTVALARGPLIVSVLAMLVATVLAVVPGLVFDYALVAARAVMG